MNIIFFSKIIKNLYQLNNQKMNINLKMKLNKIFCNTNTNNIIINNSYLFEKEKK